MKVPKAKKQPSGSWFIQLRLGGASIPITARTEKECTRQAQLIKAEYLTGKRQPPKPEGEKYPTLTEAIDQYLAARDSALSPATVRGYTRIQENRFKGLMQRSLSDITDEEYLEACNQEAKLCSAKTLKNAWSFVRSVVEYTTGKKPPEAPLPQVIPNVRPFLDADEIQIFRNAVRGNKYEIPILLALTSLRRSEIMALRWENVDLKRRRILVKGAAVFDKDNKLVQKPENKNQSSTRYVPILMDELYEALKAAKKSNGLIVTCNPNTIWANIRRICERSGLPPVGIHGLRHSFASLAYHLQVPEKYTMAIGGWNDDRTMKKIYTHIAQGDVKRYEDAFSDFFKNANENANKKIG